MTDISPELVERMAAHVRAVAAKYAHIKGSLKGRHNDELREVREIVSLLPPPVDPDLIEARRMVADQVGVNYPQYYLSGGRDDWSNVQLALTAIKRGRELTESGK